MINMNINIIYSKGFEVLECQDIDQRCRCWSHSPPSFLSLNSILTQFISSSTAANWYLTYKGRLKPLCYVKWVTNFCKGPAACMGRKDLSL